MIYINQAGSSGITVVATRIPEEPVLEASLADGDLTESEANKIAIDILRKNARKLYQIN